MNKFKRILKKVLTNIYHLCKMLTNVTKEDRKLTLAGDFYETFYDETICCNHDGSGIIHNDRQWC